jgi:hypothetical protein
VHDCGEVPAADEAAFPQLSGPSGAANQRPFGRAAGRPLTPDGIYGQVDRQFTKNEVRIPPTLGPAFTLQSQYVLQSTGGKPHVLHREGHGLGFTLTMTCVNSEIFRSRTLAHASRNQVAVDGLGCSCYSCRLTKLPSLSSAGSSCSAISAGSAVLLIDRCRQTA